MAYDVLSKCGRVSSRGFDFESFARDHCPLLKEVELTSRFPNLCTYSLPFAFPDDRYIARIKRHVFALVDGEIIDDHETAHARILNLWRVGIDWDNDVEKAFAVSRRFRELTLMKLSVAGLLKKARLGKEGRCQVER